MESKEKKLEQAFRLIVDDLLNDGATGCDVCLVDEDSKVFLTVKINKIIDEGIVVYGDSTIDAPANELPNDEEVFE